MRRMFVALALAAGALFVLPAQADAHTGSVVCAGPGQMTLVNDWDTQALFILNGHNHDWPVSAHSSENVPAETGTYEVRWPVMFGGDGTVQPSRPLPDSCGTPPGSTTTAPPPATTVWTLPPTTSPTAPDVSTTSPTTEVPPSSPPASATVEATPVAPSPSVPPSVVSKPRPKAPAALPPTGSGRSLALIGLGLLGLGVVLALAKWVPVFPRKDGTSG